MSLAEPRLPLQIEDASRPETDEVSDSVAVCWLCGQCCIEKVKLSWTYFELSLDISWSHGKYAHSVMINFT